MNDATASVSYPTLRSVLTALLLVTLAVLLCYFFLDRPIAWYVHDHALRRYGLLDALTHIADWVMYGAVLVLLLTPLRLAMRRPVARSERVLLAMSLSVTIAVFIKNALKVVFGRAWPETWINHNPSLIDNGVYGFFWFRDSQGFHSFPSGHTTITVAAMAVLWLSLPPRWRALALLPCIGVVVGLLGMDYHFLGDTVGGAFVGAVSGLYVQRLLLRAPHPSMSSQR